MILVGKPAQSSVSMADDATKRSVLFVATLTAFITPFMGSSINVALPAIQKEFHLDAIVLTWIATTYLLSTAMFLVPFGKVADVFGRKKTFVCGITVFTVASLICGASVSIYMLLAARVIQGAGTAMIFGTGMAILSSVFPPHERGRAIGLNVAAVYVGLSFGPFLGGILTQYCTWRSVFVTMIPLGIVTIYVSAGKLKGEWYGEKGQRLDIVGSLLYAGAIVLIMLGFSGLPSLASLGEVLGGTLFAIAFLRWELKVDDPVVNVELFRGNRAFAFSSLAALINYSATFAVTFMLSLYLQYIKGLDSKSAGLVLVAQPIVMASLSPIAGRLSDKIEPQKVASSGMAITALGLLALGFLREDTSIAHIVLVLLMLGVGFALFSSPNMNAIMGSVEAKHYGLASGVVGSMRLLGQMFSMGLASLIFSLFMGRTHITSELHPVFLKSVTAAFHVFAVICVVGILPSLARGKILANRSPK